MHHQQQQQQHKMKKRIVSFFPKVDTAEILHHTNYTKEEKEMSWYSKSNLQQIKEDFKKTMMLRLTITDNNNVSSSEEQNCFEDRYIKRVLERNSIRKEARWAVLYEQEIQRRKRYFSSEKRWQDDNDETENSETTNDAIEKYIAERYNTFGKKSAANAYTTGLMDAEEASCILNTPGNSMIPINIIRKKKKKKFIIKYKNKLEKKTRKKKPKFLFQQQQRFQQWITSPSFFHKSSIVIRKEKKISHHNNREYKATTTWIGTLTNIYNV